ncbi:hypothetical protein NCC49_005231 [Naganishia albida]|nr:hypothetical protein NCC49_005231 [Naganishia albida]
MKVLSEGEKRDEKRVDESKGKQSAASQDPYATPEYTDGLPLPAEIFTIIAEFLIGENNFGSLANLNATTHLIREATNAVLWTTVLLDTITPRWNAILDKARSEGGDMMYDEAFHNMAEIEEHATRWKAESESLPNNCRYVK